MQLIHEAPPFVAFREGVPGALDGGARGAAAELVDEEHVGGEGEVHVGEPLVGAEGGRVLEDVVVFDELDGFAEEGVALGLVQGVLLVLLLLVLREGVVLAVAYVDEEGEDAHLTEQLPHHGEGEEVERDAFVTVPEVLVLDVGGETIEGVADVIPRYDSHRRDGRA